MLNVMELEVGRPTDVLVAEHVMGWRWTDYLWHDGTTRRLLHHESMPAPKGYDFAWLNDRDGTRLLHWDMPDYSRSMGAAWPIVSGLRMMVCPSGDGWGAGMFDDALAVESGSGLRYCIPWTWAEAPTPALAVCRAALRAVLTK